jgi:hypothetical protein
LDYGVLSPEGFVGLTKWWLNATKEMKLLRKANAKSEFSCWW